MQLWKFLSATITLLTLGTQITATGVQKATDAANYLKGTCVEVEIEIEAIISLGHPDGDKFKNSLSYLNSARSQVQSYCPYNKGDYTPDELISIELEISLFNDCQKRILTDHFPKYAHLPGFNDQDYEKFKPEFETFCHQNALSILVDLITDTLEDLLGDVVDLLEGILGLLGGLLGGILRLK